MALYGDNGKENGNYHNWLCKVESVGVGRYFLKEVASFSDHRPLVKVWGLGEMKASLGFTRLNGERLGQLIARAPRGAELLQSGEGKYACTRAKHCQ